MDLILRPIGLYHSEVEAKSPYQAPRQPDQTLRLGKIELFPHHQFEQALQDLSGFERIWLIFQFHQNTHWKPQVLPPRGSATKRGVFATRSPYRPNPLGLSCLKLEKIEGLCLWVLGSDLLDETPIMDIKPYLPESDSFPSSRCGWIEGVTKKKYTISISNDMEQKCQWLRNNGLEEMIEFWQRQLEYEPFDSRRKRVASCNENPSWWQLSYRTWRIYFLQLADQQLEIVELGSGYSLLEMDLAEDPYKDKDLHRAFHSAFHRTI